MEDSTSDKDHEKNNCKPLAKVKTAPPKIKPVKERRRKANLPNLDENLNKILQKFSIGEILEFKGQEKTDRGLHKGTSNRRSQYIGVLRNNKRWQSLINVGNVKRYIGTF